MTAVKFEIDHVLYGEEELREKTCATMRLNSMVCIFFSILISIFFSKYMSRINISYLSLFYYLNLALWRYCVSLDIKWDMYVCI